MGPAHSGPPPPQWTMAGYSTEGFPTAPNKEGRTDLPSPRRHDVEAPPGSTTTTPRSKNPLTDQATIIILPRWDANLPLE
jgi:hypothetical protein